MKIPKKDSKNNVVNNDTGEINFNFSVKLNGT